MSTSETPTRSDGDTSAGSDTFEFTPEQNVLFATLGSRMRFVGLFTLGLTLVALLASFGRKDHALLLPAALYGLIGLWTARAGAQFQSVAWTKAHDIHHLMAALRDLKKMYTLQYWVSLVALVGTLILLLGTSALY